MRAPRPSALLLLLVVMLAAPAPRTTAAAHADAVRVEASRMSMACLYAIVAYGEDRGALEAALEAALDEVDRIDRLMSHYKADSPLSRLNREAAVGPVVVEPELFDFIAAAIGYSASSQGAFDVTVGPLMKTWGFFGGDGRVPAPAELDAARRRVGYRHVVLDRGRRAIRFDRPGVEIDLGGIAKGYAVDRAIALLRGRGVSAALVSAGGSTVFAMGAPPGAAGWTIDVQDPIDPARVAFSMTLADRALSVAGGSEKSFEADGIRYTHVMDPRTGRPVRGVLTAVVVTATGTLGDALDDALFVLGPEAGRTLLRRYPRSEGFLFLLEGPGVWRTVRLRPT